MTATAALLPLGLDAIAYGCTSGASVMIGPKVVEDHQAAQPGVPVTNPMSAVMRRLRHWAFRRSVWSVLHGAVTAPMREFLARGGIDTVKEVSFGEADDAGWRGFPRRRLWRQFWRSGAGPGVEAVFSSCTNLRAFRHHRRRPRRIWTYR